MATFKIYLAGARCVGHTAVLSSAGGRESPHLRPEWMTTTCVPRKSGSVFATSSQKSRVQLPFADAMAYAPDVPPYTAPGSR